VTATTESSRRSTPEAPPGAPAPAARPAAAAVGSSAAAAGTAAGTTDDLERLLGTLPPDLRTAVERSGVGPALVEIVMDLGRRPEARLAGGTDVLLNEREVTRADLDHVAGRIGAFGADNRAGIPRTLHRISALRNRTGAVVGLTLRVGRAVRGTVEILRDLVVGGKSLLLLGRPGVGKTTLLREVARVLADDVRRRVVIVDTSNEIAGDGDIPHPGIGRARRLQVPTPERQHAVMIEAVENHMPEVIVIDEIGTELEAAAARTIAERGVQLVGTAHGLTLENLLLNPTLADLVGGIQPVTLGDEEARRRGTQKTVLERKGPPTFDVLVEMQEQQRIVVHRDVAETVDAILRGQATAVELRLRRPDGEVERRLEVPGRWGGGESALGEPRGRRHSPRGRGVDRGAFERGLDHEGAAAPRFDTPERAERGPRSPFSERLEGLPRADLAPTMPAMPAMPPMASARTLPEGAVADPEEARWAESRRLPGTPAAQLSPTVQPAPAAPDPLADGAPQLESGDDHGDLLPPIADGGRFRRTAATLRPVRLYPFGVNRDRLEEAIGALRLPVSITKDLRDADVVMTLKNYYRRSPGPVRDAEAAGKPVFILKSNTTTQIQQSLETLYALETADPPRDLEDLVMRETQDAINRVLRSSQSVELPPQNAYIRRLQHQLAEQFQVGSRSTGREPHRRVKLYRLGSERDRWS
jgi:stage III sporulation protein SpoIIIAA